MELIFEQSRPGRRAVRWDALDVPEAHLPQDLCRTEAAALPEVSELDVIRHFTHLSRRNVGVDGTFYPLGSCTMKYNPKLAEAVAALPGFAGLHPHLSSAPEYWPECQGALAMLHELQNMLVEVSGMKAVSLQPMAGSHGELAGMLMIAAYHLDKGHTHKNTILVPDSAHGTNPASAAMAGFRIVEVPSNAEGQVDLERFKAEMNDSVAGIMLTCPNTHGLFETQILQIAELAHQHDALLYYDGANLNAIVGQCRPGDLGFDVLHFNLHKTFATPHGMGGPGAGPVGAGARLAAYLPGPNAARQGDAYALETPANSIGRMSAFFGNFLIALRAYTYLRYHGGDGLREVARNAVLNANYVMARLKDAFPPAYPGYCMHECVLTAAPQAEQGFGAWDIAKALLDAGFHAPTVYFPLTVKESIMIEPTETESKETLDKFCDAMLAIAERAKAGDPSLHEAPFHMPATRLDGVKAAKDLNCAAL